MTARRGMLRTAFPLAVSLLLASAPAARLAAAEPSFDCGTARTARELATCADAKIAAADRELAAAWQHAVAGLDPATMKALRADQKKFLEDLDNGFDGEVWGKQGAPEGKELRAQIARLRRGGDFDALAGLEAQLRERIAFLRDLTPASSYAGLWKNHDTELWLAADGGERRYRATFGMTTFGWAKYHCHFTAEFAATDKGFAAAAPHNTDPAVDEDAASTLSIARSGAMLVLSEEIPDNAGEAKLPRICPRGGDFADPLFHTGLKAEQAYRLKPDD
jgi:uncharacterized protein YecT (DUF1311 family)